MNGRFSSPPFREGQLLQVRGQLLLPVRPPFDGTWWLVLVIAILFKDQSWEGPSDPFPWALLAAWVGVVLQWLVFPAIRKMGE